MVGAEGFEPPTLCSQSRCATRLRYAPMLQIDCIADGPQNHIPAAETWLTQPDQHPDHKRHEDYKGLRRIVSGTRSTGPYEVGGDGFYRALRRPA